MIDEKTSQIRVSRANRLLAELGGIDILDALEELKQRRAAESQSVEGVTMFDIEELRRVVCGIGVVGQIDGHDVIRRDSVIDLIDRRRLASDRPSDHVLVPKSLIEWAQQNIDCIEDEDERQRVSAELGKYLTSDRSSKT